MRAIRNGRERVGERSKIRKSRGGEAEYPEESDEMMLLLSKIQALFIPNFHGPCVVGLLHLLSRMNGMDE